MTNSTPRSTDEFTIPRHRLGPEGRVDDQGYLHTGSADAIVSGLVVTCERPDGGAP